MRHNRVMFAGTGSGCGKTTVTCAVMKALCNQGVPVVPFKCGPDYIDPMFHSHITGRTSTNLDSYFINGNDLRWLMDKQMSANGHLGIKVSTNGQMDKQISINGHSEGKISINDTVGIVEGVMGLFDGIGLTETASSFEVARLTQTPVILVVNARGMALSLIALLSGYQAMAEKLGAKELLRGVILNHVGVGMYHYFKDAVYEQTGMEVVGYFEDQLQGALASRHLGLITAAEIDDLDERMAALSKAAGATIQLERVMAIAGSAPPLNYEMPEFTALTSADALPAGLPRHPLRLAFAKDKAFCFYYEENLSFLKQLGVELVPFSPLTDRALPDNISGMYLGGGYPELFAGKLAENKDMLRSVKTAALDGIPLIAECGGFMYLHEQMDGLPMAGVIEGSCRMTKKLGPFGYVRLDSEQSDIFGGPGFKMRGHEFHYSTSDNCGDCYCISKSNGKHWREVFADQVMYAGYPHVYFYSNPQAAVSFVKAMHSYSAAY